MPVGPRCDPFGAQPLRVFVPASHRYRGARQVIPGLTLSVSAGRTITEVCEEAQTLADTLNRGVGFTFNSVRCVAVPGGSAEKLADAQQEGSRSRIVAHSDTCKLEIELDDGR